MDDIRLTNRCAPSFPRVPRGMGEIFAEQCTDCKIAMDHCFKDAISINLKRQNNAFEAKIFLGSSSSGPKRSAAHRCLVFPFPVTSLLVAFVIMMRGLLTVDIRYNIPCQAYNFSPAPPTCILDSCILLLNSNSFCYFQKYLNWW